MKSDLQAGMSVVFDVRVFKPPYTPYYDEYKGHVFQIVKIHTTEPYGDPEAPHAELICIDDSKIRVDGNVDLYLLEQVYAKD
jgi:hypothetical protein